LDVLNALEAACKHMCQFDTDDCYVQQSWKCTMKIENSWKNKRCILSD
jgi:hypothetical protein